MTFHITSFKLFAGLVTLSAIGMAGYLAYIFCYTLNPAMIGGPLPWVLLTMPGVIGFVFGHATGKA